MRRIIPTILLLFSAAFLFTACLSDDTDSTTYYGDTAITSFSLSYGNRNMHTLSYLDSDSVYSDELDSASKYVFYIDQAKCEIYNPDSLPIWTDSKKILCTIGSKNSGTIVYKSLTSDTLSYYSSSDTIDFSQPREFRVYSSDGTAYRKYTIKVNVHQEQADSFQWHQLADNAEVAALEGMKAFEVNGKILLFGKKGNDVVLYTTANTDGNSWSQQTISPALDTAVYKNIIKHGNSLYVVNKGQVMTSTDGTTWKTVATANGIDRFVAASTTELYGMNSSNTLVCSTDGGTTWNVESLDDDAKYLPVQNISYVTVAQSSNDSTDRVMLVGNRSNTDYSSDISAVVWNKVVEYDNGSQKNAWVYYNRAEDNKSHLLPCMYNLTVIPYDGKMIAIGGNGIAASTVSAFSKMYVSRDMGITWQNESVYAFPSKFSSSATSFTAISDSNNNIWLFGGKTGQIWRGHLNKLAWPTYPTTFTK